MQLESENALPGARRYPLIGPEDPPPFSIHNADGSAPVLIVCDHASRAIPKGMNQLGVADWVLDRHVAWTLAQPTLVAISLMRSTRQPS